MPTVKYLLCELNKQMVHWKAKEPVFKLLGESDLCLLG